MNSNVSSEFQKYCQEAIKKITPQDLDNFKNAKDDESKIKIIFEFAKSMPITPTSHGKDIKLAQDEKTNGNKYFSEKNYRKALLSYNKGIVACPQDTDEAKELLTILIANRSATFFEIKEYKRVFNDIDYLLEIGAYPKKLQHKIWLRKAKCYDILQNEKMSSEAYAQAYESFKFTSLNEDEIKIKIDECEKNRINCPYVIHKDVVPFCSTSEVFIGSKEYISAHNNLYFEYDKVQGRHAKAAENLETGLTIIEELPHCVAVASEHAQTNCQHCLLSTNQVYACPDCAHAVYCSANCLRQSLKSYHKFECKFLRSLYESGASINCFMALRIVTQRSNGFFREKKKQLGAFLKDNCKRVALKKSPYKPDDYDNVFFLCRNEIQRKKEELVHYCCMAIYLLKMLKTSSFFGTNVNDDELNDDQTFVAALILRHLEILQFNSHEVSELRNTDGSADVTESLYKSEFIGAGLYPTLALFNHSCDPSIVRYNIGSKMVVKTIKPIKAGEIIYENYGPLYTTMKKEYRQKFLLDRYWFECLCAACSDFWPLLESMDENELRIPCKKERCPYVFVIHRDDCMPFLDCPYCRQSTSLIPFLKGLMELQNILPIAEDLYCRGEFDSATKKYVDALNILFSYSKPPCPDMVKIQQRLRTCMVHNGNKEVNYKPIYT